MNSATPNRKYGNYGQAGGELAFDKAPNRGHFTFSDGKTSLITEFIVKQPYEGPIIDAHAIAVIKASRWMVDTLESYQGGR